MMTKRYIPQVGDLLRTPTDGPWLPQNSGQLVLVIGQHGTMNGTYITVRFTGGRVFSGLHWNSIAGKTLFEVI